MRKLIQLGILVLVALPIRAQMTGSAHRREPYLPKVWIASTINSTNFADLFSSPVTKTVCASGCDYPSIQAAFDGIATAAPTCGEIITVTAGFTTTLGNGATPPTFSSACPTNKHIWLRTSAYASLPAQGTRVASSDTSNMFEIAKTAGTTADSCFYVADGAAGLVVTGMYVHNTATFVQALALIGSSTNSSGFANHIWFDRCYLDADHTVAQTVRGIYLGAFFFSLTDSVVDGILHLNSDACNHQSDYQDFLAYNTPGQIKLVNDYFGGAPTENIMFGGSVSAAGTIQPADIEIRRSALYKDPSYYETADIKNILEFKVGTRALVDGNVLQYSAEEQAACNGSQKGQAIDFTVRANGSTGQGNQISDITFTNNDIQHFNIAWLISGHDDAGSDANNTWSVTKRVKIKNNLFRDINGYYDMGTLSSFGGWRSTTAADITSNVATFTFASCCYGTWGIGSGMAVRGFTGADTDLNMLWNTITSMPTNQVTMSMTHADLTATSNGQMSAMDYAIHSISMNGGYVFYPGGRRPDSGVFYLDVANNAFYGSVCIPGFTCYTTSTNKAGVVYWNSAKGAGAPNLGGVWPSMHYRNNVSVTDATGSLGDSAPTIASNVTNGALPGAVWSGNLLFNWTHTGTSTCSNFPASGMASNPGECLTGKSSDPATINSTLGSSDYATCAAGDTTPGDTTASLDACAITGTYAGKGPDIQAIKDAQVLDNDTTKWGPRTAW